MEEKAEQKRSKRADESTIYVTKDGQVFYCPPRSLAVSQDMATSGNIIRWSPDPRGGFWLRKTKGGQNERSKI